MTEQMDTGAWETALAARAREALTALAANPPVAGERRLTRSELARMIDHTLLKADATPEMVARLCEEALQYRFASVCVNPYNVRQCAEALRDSEVLVCSVAGFPLGASLPRVKAFEAAQAVADGAREVDMVINIGALRSGAYRVVLDDVKAVVEACHAGGAHTKVILETSLLTDEEKAVACLVCREAGADFVKTSTGLSTGGATPEDVALMRAVVGPDMGVKAAGGIRDYAAAVAVIRAGANRIGASAGIKVLEGASA